MWFEASVFTCITSFIIQACSHLHRFSCKWFYLFTLLVLLSALLFYCGFVIIVTWLLLDNQSLHHIDKPDRFSRIGTCPCIVFRSHCEYGQDHPQSSRIDHVVPQSSRLMHCYPTVMSQLGHISQAGFDPLSHHLLYTVLLTSFKKMIYYFNNCFKWGKLYLLFSVSKINLQTIVITLRFQN